jgi:hypothetical protein
MARGILATDGKEEGGAVGAGVIPPEPVRNWDAGDKTPAYLLWLCRYHPAEAAARYAGRTFGDSDLRNAVEDAMVAARKSF